MRSARIDKDLGDGKSVAGAGLAEFHNGGAGGGAAVGFTDKGKFGVQAGATVETDGITAGVEEDCWLVDIARDACRVIGDLRRASSRASAATQLGDAPANSITISCGSGSPRPGRPGRPRSRSPGRAPAPPAIAANRSDGHASAVSIVGFRRALRHGS